MRRSLTALLTVAVVLLAANLVVQLARPAEAQVYGVPVRQVVTIGGDTGGLYRLWSDGTIEHCATNGNDYDPEGHYVGPHYLAWRKLPK